ncbi:plasmid replication, integration and excision activator [Actinophytocola glycyrrhizae]|uniref:Plasmid replication, integration and excision activator n=1 Tax=Actinophytocola glycyrrhizae TaxID=2044873 RepID=A0ABV9RYC2_9PSEU
MPVVPTRFAVEFGEVFPFGAFVLGVEPSMAFSADASAPKQQERDKETGQLVWTVRALDANEEAARFGAEFKVKISADHQPVPPEKLPGFPFPPVEFDGLTITPYANNKGRIAHSFRARSMQAPDGAARKSAAPREPKAA